MSEENVEIVRRVFDAGARRDAATVLAHYDPEVEWDVSRTHGGMVGQTIYHGHEGLRSFFRDWSEAWENVAYDYEELLDAGEQVISVQTTRGRGRASRAGVEWTQHTGVWTVREGKIVRVVWFPTRAEALEAAGLSE